LSSSTGRWPWPCATARRPAWRRRTLETGPLRGYHLLPAARADLLRKLGRTTEATTAYQAALELAANERERAYLRRRLAEL
jgi:RNA polymerase sigma-70 factor, ECF subfamily